MDAEALVARIDNWSSCVVDVAPNQIGTWLRRRLRNQFWAMAVNFPPAEGFCRIPLDSARLKYNMDGLYAPPARTRARLMGGKIVVVFFRPLRMSMKELLNVAD